MVDYEYRALTLPPHATTGHAREVLGIHAEYGDWELVRHAIYPGGRRTVRVRRRLRGDALPPLSD